uniref:Uncharacterized protein n=1 Tax=Opuntia streptacantha TaxID=393608 RepID=A0A7C8YEH2_OPUST
MINTSSRSRSLTPSAIKTDKKKSVNSHSINSRDPSCTINVIIAFGKYIVTTLSHRTSACLCRAIQCLYSCTYKLEKTYIGPRRWPGNSKTVYRYNVKVIFCRSQQIPKCL